MSDRSVTGSALDTGRPPSRVDVNCEAALRRVGEDDWLQARALDLGVDELRLRATRGIATGTPVRVRLCTAGVRSPIELNGEIVHCAPSAGGAGFELCCRLPAAD